MKSRNEMKSEERKVINEEGILKTKSLNKGKEKSMWTRRCKAKVKQQKIIKRKENW